MDTTQSTIPLPAILIYKGNIRSYIELLGVCGIVRIAHYDNKYIHAPLSQSEQ